MKATSVRLSDHDLVKLLDSEDVSVRTAAVLAEHRLGVVASLGASVAPHVAQLVADVLDEARTSGLLLYRNMAIRVCGYCGAHATMVKPKRRRKMVESFVGGVEFAQRFITIRNYVTVGGCRACVDAALPHIVAGLGDIRAEVASPLAAPGRSSWKRYDRRRCKPCGWTGHEGEMGKLRTLFGDGWYRGKCPQCGIERIPLGVDPFERLDGFDVVVEEVAP